ncbi:Uncharacterised protein [Mycobacteroides abscessus subsp. abscessus]|nr:Uncharacterised protein [Mycobacteroides abscessus subsp. abscessus]
MPRASPNCCQAGRNRAYAAVLTGSIWARSAASDRRRRIFSTVASHHCWSTLSGRSVNSPRMSLPSNTMRLNTSAVTRCPRPNLAAAWVVVNGPLVLA